MGVREVATSNETGLAVLRRPIGTRRKREMYRMRRRRSPLAPAGAGPRISTPYLNPTNGNSPTADRCRRGEKLPTANDGARSAAAPINRLSNQDQTHWYRQQTTARRGTSIVPTTELALSSADSESVVDFAGGNRQLGNLSQLRDSIPCQPVTPTRDNRPYSIQPSLCDGQGASLRGRGAT